MSHISRQTVSMMLYEPKSISVWSTSRFGIWADQYSNARNMSLSAGMYLIQSETPLMYISRARFALVCIHRSAIALILPELWDNEEASAAQLCSARPPLSERERLKTVRASGRVKEGFSPGFRIAL